MDQGEKIVICQEQGKWEELLQFASNPVTVSVMSDDERKDWMMKYCDAPLKTFTLEPEIYQMEMQYYHHHKGRFYFRRGNKKIMIAPDEVVDELKTLKYGEIITMTFKLE